MLPSAASHNGSDETFTEIVEEYTNRVRAGESIDVESYVQRYPEHAERLRQLLPVMLDGLCHSVSTVADRAAAEARKLTLAGVLGDFRILREVGKGGMGVVYEAEQLSLRRRVALKVLPFAATMDPCLLQRFHNEAQAAACLHHTNIVPVFFVGCERDVHFYAMQFIDGQPLSEIIRQLHRLEKTRATGGEEQTVAYQPPPGDAPSMPPAVEMTPLTGEGRRGRDYYRKVAELGIQAAEALDHAHQLGIVHRDIKPGNLMLDGSGRLWVTDFGVAHMQHGDGQLTVTGQALGTPRYMSPEQALAKRVPIDHRTDVYSLGATLYELLTLQPAFAGEDNQELLRQIAFEEPRHLRSQERTIPAELEIIVLKAMEKRPQDRYATAQELADDLERWLKHEPIRAQRPTLFQRASKWLRRRPMVAALIGVSMLAVIALGFAAISVFYSQRLAEERNKAVLARDAEARQRQVAQWALRDAEQARDAEFRLHGLLYVRSHQWTEAADNLSQVVQTHPDDFEAWLGLAQARAELGRDREAIATFTQALAVNAKSVPALLQRGECYLHLEEHANAKADFAAAARLDPAAASNWHKCRLHAGAPRPDANRAILYHLHTVIEAKHTADWELPFLLQQRARLLIQLEQDAEALPDLDRILQLQPSNALVLLQRGAVYSRLGQRERAASDFTAAFERGPDLRDPWSPDRARIDDELNRSEEVFARLAQLHPRERQLWLGRALARIRQGQWQSAAEAMTQVIELEPSNSDAWFFDAPLRLALNDIEGYRRDCREMLQRFGQTHSPSVADQTAKTCLLQPDGMNDLALGLRLAEQAIAGTEDHIAYPWFLTDRALADYRGGEFARAVVRLKNVHPLPGDVGLEATVFVLLAMAHHRLNQTAEARTALDKARLLEEKKFPRLDRGQRFDEGWHNWLRYRVLRREAETLIEKEKSLPKNGRTD